MIHKSLSSLIYANVKLYSESCFMSCEDYSHIEVCLDRFFFQTDEEWKEEHDEQEADYSGLRIKTLTIE